MSRKYISLKTKQHIWERDGWKCRQCGEAIDQGLTYPDPLSRSIDHVLALANGGHPTSVHNLQSTHLRCNLTKGTKRTEPWQWWRAGYVEKVEPDKPAKAHRMFGYGSVFSPDLTIQSILLRYVNDRQRHKFFHRD